MSAPLTKALAAQLDFTAFHLHEMFSTKSKQKPQKSQIMPILHLFLDSFFFQQGCQINAKKSH
jgi:hypothetical protein